MCVSECVHVCVCVTLLLFAFPQHHSSGTALDTQPLICVCVRARERARLCLDVVATVDDKTSCSFSAGSFLQLHTHTPPICSWLPHPVGLFHLVSCLFQSESDITCSDLSLSYLTLQVSFKCVFKLPICYQPKDPPWGTFCSNFQYIKYVSFILNYYRAIKKSKHSVFYPQIVFSSGWNSPLKHI